MISSGVNVAGLLCPLIESKFTQLGSGVVLVGAKTPNGCVFEVTPFAANCDFGVALMISFAAGFFPLWDRSLLSSSPSSDPFVLFLSVTFDSFLQSVLLRLH